MRSIRLVKLCVQLLSEDPFLPHQLYTTGLAPSVLSYMMGVEIVPKFRRNRQADEVGLLPGPKNGLTLPAELPDAGRSKRNAGEMLEKRRKKHISVQALARGNTQRY